MRRMLKEGGSPPGGRFAELALLEPVRHYKARHGSVLLTFDAIEKAIAEIEEKRAATADAASA
jgi:NifU-like protein involved in Fe-S cluster formation